MEFELSNGIALPSIGFGTYRATEGNGEKVILDALETGYRYFDTASFYDNEAEIGNAVREYGIGRKELFLCSKVWKSEMGYDNAKKAFDRSLDRLQTDYLDLYLIHWPKEKPDSEDWKQKLQATWKAMEELYAQGKVRAIGLSNFLPHHIEALKETVKVRPMVNQLELHVGYMQEFAVRYCKENRIQLQAWSPLGRRRMLEEPEVMKMAQKYGVTVAEFLLRFLLQDNIAVIPKASTKERMKANLYVPEFTIDIRDMYFIKSFPQMGWSGEHPDLGRL